MVSLMTGLIPGCIAPAALHRVLVAKSDKAIAQGMALVHAYPYAFFTPGILMGVTKAAIFPSGTVGQANGNAFALMVDQFGTYGGIYSFVSIILLVSCLASFMSSADSLVLASSNQVTADFYKGWAFPNASSHSQLMFSKVCSGVVMATSISIALYADLDLFKALNYVFGFYHCCFPAFILGIWTDVHSRPVILGCITCIITLVVAETFVEAGTLKPVGATSAFYVFVVGVPMTWTYEMLFRAFAPQYLNDEDMSRWDAVENYQRWGKKVLTGTMVDEMMSAPGVTEPTSTLHGKLMWVIGCILPFLLAPWYGEENDEQPKTGGLPRYAARIMLGNWIVTIILIYQSMCMWRGPDGEEDPDGPKTNIQKWAAKSGAGELGINQMYRKMSHEALKGEHAFKVDDSVPSQSPNSTIDHLRKEKAKKNTVVPAEASVPGAVDDDGMIS
jgi:hypothetical protein